MAGKFRLRIVTPTRNMFDNDVEMAIMRGQEGDFAIMSGHAPFVTMLAYGTLRIRLDDMEREAAVMGGLVEVSNNVCTVLTDTAEWPEEIDVSRAEEDKIRAERKIHEAKSDADIRRAELALRRALVRIEVSSYPLIKGKY